MKIRALIVGMLMLIGCGPSLQDPPVARPASGGGQTSSTASGGGQASNGQPSSTKGPAIDRLAWLSDLIVQLKASPRPSCVGPRGCATSFVDDSPCLSPVNKTPDVIIDGVLPGGGRDTFVVAYRLMCSACYLGGAGFLASVRTTGRNVRILDTVTLNKETEDEIPTLIEMNENDADADGRPEIVVQYGYETENEHKCTGMRNASTFLLIVRAIDGRISTLIHEQLNHTPMKKGRPFITTFRFSDENEDDYPDLILSRTIEPDLSCNTKTKKCTLVGETGIYTIHTVLPYTEDKGDWSAHPYTGYTLTDGADIDCDVPLPETPFAVVAGLHPGKQLTEKMEAAALAIRRAGFPRACIFNGNDFEGLEDNQFAVIADAFSKRSIADDTAETLRKAGFRPFVKEVF